MQDLFGERAEQVKILGTSTPVLPLPTDPNEPIQYTEKTEKIVFKRASQSYGSYLYNYVFNGLLADNTELKNGDMVYREKDNGTYFIVARRHGAFSEIGKLIKANSEICIVRKVTKYVHHTKVGAENKVIATCLANFRVINGNMYAYEDNLLPTSMVKFIVGMDKNIRLGDKIYFKEDYDAGDTERVFTVDFLDNETNTGALTIQCTIDTGNKKTV